MSSMNRNKPMIQKGIRVEFVAPWNRGSYIGTVCRRAGNTVTIERKSFGHSFGKHRVSIEKVKRYIPKGHRNFREVST